VTFGSSPGWWKTGLCIESVVLCVAEESLGDVLNGFDLRVLLVFDFLQHVRRDLQYSSLRLISQLGYKVLGC
jgi:hypothetical protein